MQRKVTPELVDQASPEPVLLAESLTDLAGLNRYLGGTATILHQLGRLLDGSAPARIRVLDVGAGGADIVVALARWCDRHGIGFEAGALDSGRETARIASAYVEESGHDERIEVVCGDARALPFADGAFDVTICSTFLHHLEADDAVAALTEMARVSELGVIVSDLRRGWPGYLASWILANTVWRHHRYTHHDATVSMRAAYTIAEAHGLAEQAGLAPDVEPQLWFRWALRWKRP